MTESQPTISAPEAAQNNKTSIDYYREQYDAADTFARAVASFRDDVSIPANNELRYAGYHLMCALDDKGGIKDKDQLSRAISHCQRAMYEAADAGILSALDMIEIFKKEYHLVCISDVVKNYELIIKDARKAQKMLETTRKHNSSGALISNDYKNTFEKLRDHCETLEDAREELNKKIRKENQEWRRFIITISFTALGVLFAALGVLLASVSLMDSDSTEKTPESQLPAQHSTKNPKE